MKSTHLPATTVKTLLALAQQPHARIILVNETSFLLDAQLHAHKLISNKTFSSMQSKQWITTPQERGQQLAECALTERGKAVAASIEALKLQFQQLPLDLEFITKHVEATQLAFSALPETVPQAEEPEAEAIAPAQSEEPEATATAPHAEIKATIITGTPYNPADYPAIQTEDQRAAGTTGMYFSYTSTVCGHTIKAQYLGFFIRQKDFDEWAKIVPNHLCNDCARQLEITQESSATTSLAATTTALTPQDKQPTNRKRRTKEEIAAERKEKRAKMQADMHQTVQNLLESLKAGKSEHLLQYLAFSSKFHTYSPLNQILIAMQAPQASRVAGYAAWKNAGYQVKPGAKGIAILAPRPYTVTKSQKHKETDAEEMIVHQGITFRIVHVFDVSQLEENPDKPIPSFFISLTDDHELLYQRIAQAVREEDIELEIGDTGSAQGWSAGGHIRLKAGLDSTNRCLTLIHEFAHEKLHHNEAGRAMTTNKKECHAEAIAYVVAAHFGLDNPYSSDYLLSWGNTEKELLAELETVKDTASAIIEAIEARAEEKAPIHNQQAQTCHYCQQPAAQDAQIINDVIVCATCIAQELATIHPDELESPTPTDPEPEPPTPTPAGGPTESTESHEERQIEEPETMQETESQAKPETGTRQAEAPEQTSTTSQTEAAAASAAPVPEATETTRQSKRQRRAEAKKQGAHRVSLCWQSDAYTVSDEGYQKIEAIIKEYATCHRCEQLYTAERPNVAGNICLTCFLQHSGRNHGLTYVGPGETRADGYPSYLFIDRTGRIYISDPGPSRSEDARESYTDTLKYWSFRVPEYIEKNGQRIEIKGAYWSIYGDPRKSVVITHVWDTYPDKAEAFYLVSKTAKMTQINKRKASHRALFVEARKRLEATKKNGKYYIGEESYNYINEWHEHRMIAQMLDENPYLWP